MRRLASFDLILVLALVLAVSGRAALNRWESLSSLSQSSLSDHFRWWHTWCKCTKVSRPCKAKILSSWPPTSICLVIFSTPLQISFSTPLCKTGVFTCSPGAVDWVMMQSCFGHHFMLVLEKQEKFDGHQQFFAIVQLIGTRKQAENFAYRSHFM